MSHPIPTRLHLEITGQVQGVGFRPYCHSLAQRLGLSGWVLNHGGGVSIEIQGTNAATFVNALKTEQPPLARIDYLEQTDISIVAGEQGFKIRRSQQSPITAAIPPDSSVCPDCLNELFNPHSRYYRYPFLNCTNCGPRYTVMRKLPYDRCNTSMAPFKLCPACENEYNNPDNRRFHAQATACRQCGPQLSMNVEEIVQRLQQGQILAIKGLGGFHLVCDAKNHNAVQTLRHRKQREAKPFAIMAANIASIAQLVTVNSEIQQQLESPQRPIVLAPKKEKANLSPAVAPGLNSLGVVLPYTPLHYLIFNATAGNADGTQWLHEPQDLTLVLTSANPGGEPLVIDNEEAAQRLSDIADAIVDHNRDIVTRCDDTVVQMTKGTPHFVRRARSFVPQPIQLPHDIPPTLAVGGHLKNTVCVTRGNQAFLSQHIGELDNRATFSFFEETVDHLLNTLGVTPEVIAHDMHPDFFSTRYAQSFGKPTYAIQHHHAHLAAVMAEHKITTAAIGLALDGFGLGENNQSWGGELMLLEGAEYQHLGHLAPLKQPGGDRAAREPWRMAASVYDQLNSQEQISQHFSHQPGAKQLAQMLEKDLNCPPTSSGGRLFDAAAGLLGVQEICDYEGQAAMMLESLVTQPKLLRDGWHIENNRLDLLPLLKQLGNCDQVEGANLFHGTLIAALGDWLQKATRQCNTQTIVLAGGCFLNQVLTIGLVELLSKQNFSVRLAQQAPTNDGGLSLGQAWIAGQMKY